MAHILADLHPEFLVDEKGARKSVLLPLPEFERLVEALEDREDSEIAEARLRDSSGTIPWDEVRREMLQRPRS